MNKFVLSHIIEPFKGRWARGLALLLLWTGAFIALPAISGWFLAMCSVAFVTANTVFSYLIPSAIIRLLALLRTATRYFERIENHKTTLLVQQDLQLKVFSTIARLPYFKKQGNNNVALLENSTQGIDQILNHLLLWLLPFAALLLCMGIYALFVGLFSHAIALEFLISSATLLFLVPQFFFRKNKVFHNNLKSQREENNLALIQSFRGRIEIAKYQLEQHAISQFDDRLTKLEDTEHKLQINSFYLQMAGGLGFSLLAAVILRHAHSFGIDASTAIGIFFGIMAQTELAEMLFSGKSERSAVALQITYMNKLLRQSEQAVGECPINTTLETITIEHWRAQVPKTQIQTNELTLNIHKGEWIALFGETGKGKTTLLNSLFHSEYRLSGTMQWNKSHTIRHLPIPQCIYVTQKAYLLTGTLRENFQGYSDKAIERVLQIVDLAEWRKTLSEGLDTWIGENGETLSGGQRKKLLLAQALLKQPQLLVVDEPTAGIGATDAIVLFQTIRNHHPNMAILMATHLREFEQVADCVVEI